MEHPNHDPNVCSKDPYGNVTANKQDGNDIRNEMQYSGYTIDVGITCMVWNPDNSFFGKFPDLASAKASIDAVLS